LFPSPIAAMPCLFSTRHVGCSMRGEQTVAFSSAVHTVSVCESSSRCMYFVTCHTYATNPPQLQAPHTSRCSSHILCNTVCSLHMAHFVVELTIYTHQPQNRLNSQAIFQEVRLCFVFRSTLCCCAV
jgi:hypothetical protein